MSHERKRTSFTYEQSLVITDDDGDQMQAIKHGNRDWVMVENTSPYGDGIHVAVRLNKSDARALRRFLGEFLSSQPGDDDDE